MTSWKEMADYGVIKINGSQIQLFSSQFNYEYLYPSGYAVEAHWVGTSLIVTLEDGTKKRYKGLWDSEIIR